MIVQGANLLRRLPKTLIFISQIQENNPMMSLGNDGQRERRLPTILYCQRDWKKRKFPEGSLKNQTLRGQLSNPWNYPLIQPHRGPFLELFGRNDGRHISLGTSVDLGVRRWRSDSMWLMSQSREIEVAWTRPTLLFFYLCISSHFTSHNLLYPLLF